MTTINFTGGSSIKVAEAYSVVKTKMQKSHSFELTKVTGHTAAKGKQITVNKSMVCYLENED